MLRNRTGLCVAAGGGVTCGVGIGSIGRFNMGMGVGRGVIVGVERRTLPSDAYCAIKGGGNDANRGGSTQYVDGDTPARAGSIVEGPGVTLGVVPGDSRLSFGVRETGDCVVVGLLVVAAEFAFAIRLRNGFRGFCVGVAFTREDGGGLGRG